ncbi:predicted protein [Lodderomyces elongisporus NRRL YB-4239]|uniref:Uncharacterized protein n=1 Tax=Lodderomyces elongisporus (strain ATCC 11503 / CBS 2605 / JCM 1781 / NBRC 1676 / NRRL YB-4239) TaxID=379508 RepID=A5DYM1_LODEL|nr:predicted protein [Lodderomyces elongisporus NRRL YB-4239]
MPSQIHHVSQIPQISQVPQSSNPLVRGSFPFYRSMGNTEQPQTQPQAQVQAQPQAQTQTQTQNPPVSMMSPSGGGAYYAPHQSIGASPLQHPHSHPYPPHFGQALFTPQLVQQVYPIQSQQPPPPPTQQQIGLPHLLQQQQQQHQQQQHGQVNGENTHQSQTFVQPQPQPGVHHSPQSRQ